MRFVPVLSVLFSGAEAARASSNETSGSTNSALCRCALTNHRTNQEPAFVDCYRPGQKLCQANSDVTKELKNLAKKSEMDVEKMNVECLAININGEYVDNQNYATVLNTARVMPKGVIDCAPKDITESPLHILADYYTGISSTPPQMAVSATAPVALAKECMYCEGKRIDGETACCSAVSDFTGLELPKQCRYPDNTGGFKTYHTPIPKAAVDNAILEGQDPGELCCSGRAVVSLSQQWECRPTIGNEELLFQMKMDGDVQYKKIAFQRYMWDTYIKKIKPIEEASMFDFYDTPLMTSGEVMAKPLVMLVGPYSSGKTTFINHVLGEAYPGAVTGIEPTTDAFTIVQSGANKKVPGFALSADPRNNFQGVAADLGIAFQRYFEAAQLKNPVLNDVTFLDTPGVLSGAKQSRKAKGYDFNKAIDWFAGRADITLIFFDIHRLDLSDEMGEVMRLVSRDGRHRRVRIVLNKADLVKPQDLMRAYGTIMWYMSQAVRKPDVPHVHMGNFGGFEYKNKEMAEYFDWDREFLYKHVMHNIIPANAATTKVDRFIERARRLRAHALLFDRLRTVAKKALPHAKKKTQRKIIADLPTQMKQVARRKDVNIGDFQTHEKLAQKLEEDEELKLRNIPNLNKKMMALLDEAIGSDLPRLVDAISKTYGVDVDDLTRKALGR